MKKVKKLLAAVLALTVALSLAGCSGPDTKAPADPSADGKGTQTVGGNAQAVEGLGVYDADGLRMTATKVEQEPGRSKIHLYLENLTGDAIGVEWTALALDDRAVGGDCWFPEEWKPKIQPGAPYEEILYIDDPTAEDVLAGCGEIALEANVQFGEGGAARQTTFRLPVEGLEALATEHGPAPKGKTVLTAAEQELWNDDGLYAVIPEQALKGGQLLVHVENNRERFVAVSFMDVCVNGELIWEGAINVSDMEVAPGTAEDGEFYLDDVMERMLASDADADEISFVLCFTEDQQNALAAPAVTVPITVTEEP